MMLPLLMTNMQAHKAGHLSRCSMFGGGESNARGAEGNRVFPDFTHDTQSHNPSFKFDASLLMVITSVLSRKSGLNDENAGCGGKKGWNCQIWSKLPAAVALKVAPASGYGAPRIWGNQVQGFPG